jgi:hypothetical protein
LSIEDGSEAKLMSKAYGQAAKLSFSGHALMDNCDGERLRRLACVGLALLALEVHPGILIAAACAVAVAAMRIVVVILLRPEALEGRPRLDQRVVDSTCSESLQGLEPALGIEPRTC